MIRIILGPCQGHFRFYLIDSTKVISSKVAKFGSMYIVELYGDILQPWGGNLRPLVLFYLMDSTKVIASKVANFGSMDIVESHGDILHPGGQLETPGLVIMGLENL